MTLPPLHLNFNATSGVDAGPVVTDHSGFVVNYGGSASTGLPPWLLLVAGLAVGLWLIRRKG